MLENILFTICVGFQQSCFTSHLYVICRNHGNSWHENQDYFRNWLTFIKNAELGHKCRFLLSGGGSAGLNVQMLARPAWCGSLGVYALKCVSVGPLGGALPKLVYKETFERV